MQRRQFTLAGAAALGTLALGQAPRGFAQGAPIRVGSTLSLTGPLAPASIIHRIVGEIYIEDLNRRGGLLGRPVEWILKDDQSRPDLARTLYEQLVTTDRVDLLVGPYATGLILSAMGVAQRFNKVLVHHSFGVPSLAKYDLQFPTGGLPADPEVVIPKLIFEGTAAGPKPPQSVAIVTSKFPSVHFISVGARDAAKKRGLKEVAWLEWDFGNRDFGAIAARIRDAKPDLLWAGALGIESTQLIDAMAKIDYVPPQQVHLFPAVGPMGKLPQAKNALALTVFEEHPPFTDNPVAAQMVKTYKERATKANLPDTSADLFVGISTAMWQTFEAGVKGAGSLDDKAIGAWLKRSQVDTVIGRLRWDGPNNHIPGLELYRLKQFQDGKWSVVYPREFAAPGVKMVAS